MQKNLVNPAPQEGAAGGRWGWVKFGGIGFIIVLLGVGALLGIQHMRYLQSPEYTMLKKYEDLKKQYAADTYGGRTPEETLQLFIDALKKGDIDLASKYFVIEKQEKWRIDLAKIQEKGLLGDMLADLEKIELSKKEADIAFFAVANEKNEVTTQMILKKILNRRWKISEL